MLPPMLIIISYRFMANIASGTPNKHVVHSILFNANLDIPGSSVGHMQYV
jgi:hypothetical protein